MLRTFKLVLQLPSPCRLLFKLEYIPANSAELFFKIRF